ncbi:MAG: hypothetical protein ACYSU7_05450, partial [Planctomycetota bacterium]
MTGEFLTARIATRRVFCVMAAVIAVALNAAATAQLTPGNPGSSHPGAPALAFVENQGQWETPALFVARRGPMLVALDQDGLRLRLQDGRSRSGRGAVIRLAFDDAHDNAEL